MNDVDRTPTSRRAAIIADFARSELFNHTFQEGMDLVEEVAAYLDGAGRRDSKLLSRNAALAYAAESMRLTTRLMQVASWLLVQRAVRQGEMSPELACERGYRLGGDAAPGKEAGGSDGLPHPLNQLLDRSARLYERVRHLDRRMYLDAEGESATGHSVHSQMDRLRGAFNG